MKTIFALFSAVFFLSLLACSSPKMIIESGKTKHKLKVNSSLAITMKGEIYPFDESCTKTCKNCDSVLVNSRWTMDSLGVETFLLRFEHSYIFDTISNREFKDRSKSERKKNIHAVLVNEKKPIYVYKIPDSVEYKLVRVDQLETITYSDRPECYKGSPFKSIFHNPNKIRKIMMPGALVTLKKKD